MWQVLLAAAVAGSGYFAKQLLHSNGAEPTNNIPQTEENCSNETETLVRASSSSNPEAVLDKETIFRFSSASGSKKSVKKKSGSRGVKGKRGNLVGNVEKELVEDQRKSGKRFAVCLKKRRTSRNGGAKCESPAPKDNSSFGWGVGVGIMYMMSAGKAEISRLNEAMDETAKVVQELKTEIAKRKSSRILNVSSSNPSKSKAEHVGAVSVKLIPGEDDGEVFGLAFTDEGECAGSVLTEEPQHEVLEMDQLQAELESELQKLPGCSTQTSYHDGGVSSNSKMEVPSDDFSDVPMYQCNGGILPSELDQKLCHVLIEQQESQIAELESSLRKTNSKLSEKETELQALKDCVKRLTEFSLACPSDEETEAKVDEQEMIDGICDKLIPELKKSVVGSKRAMEFGSYDCNY